MAQKQKQRFLVIFFPDGTAWRWSDDVPRFYNLNQPEQFKEEYMQMVVEADSSEEACRLAEDYYEQNIGNTKPICSHFTKKNHTFHLWKKLRKDTLKESMFDSTLENLVAQNRGHLEEYSLKGGSYEKMAAILPMLEKALRDQGLLKK